MSALEIIYYHVLIHNRLVAKLSTRVMKGIYSNQPLSSINGHFLILKECSWRTPKSDNSFNSNCDRSTSVDLRQSSMVWRAKVWWIVMSLRGSEIKTDLNLLTPCKLMKRFKLIRSINTKKSDKNETCFKYYFLTFKLFIWK